MIQKESTYHKPSTVEETIELISNRNGKIIAGGTDLMVNEFHGISEATELIDISNISCLFGIQHNSDDEMLRIGPLETLESVAGHPILKAHFPILSEACEAVGSPLIRKSATIGGNLMCENRCLFFNQSEWWRNAVGNCLKSSGATCIATGGKKACFSELVSDTAPALFVLDAELHLASKKGQRKIKINELYSGNGVSPKTISEGEMITDICVPLKKSVPDIQGGYYKLRQRKSLDFTSLTVAVSKNHEGRIRIALSGVDPGLVHFDESGPYKIQDVVSRLTKASRAVENDMLGRKYRKSMIEVFINKALKTFT